MDTAVTLTTLPPAINNAPFGGQAALLRDMLAYEDRAATRRNTSREDGWFLISTSSGKRRGGNVSLMGPNDHVITAYPDHGHALAVGMGMNECMAELFEK